MDTLILKFQEHRWASITGLFAVIIVYVIFTEVFPRIGESFELYSEWRNQKGKIESAENWESETLHLKTEQKRLERRFTTFFVALPKSDQMSAILELLQKKADENSVSVKQLHPQEKVSYETYDELPLQIEMTGRFHKIARFISSIEQSQYLMKVQDLNLTSESLASSRLNVKFLLNVITLKDQKVKRGGSE